MSAARQLPRTLLAMGASLAVLSACSTGSLSPTVDAGACTGASPAELTSSGSGEVCADTGFHPGSDGFSFANWGGTPTDDAIDSGTLIAMFGREPVCADDNPDSCTMRPAARAWMNQMNEALANGRCEGMAVLSERLFAGLAKTSELDPRATRTIELARTEPAVARTLGYWWLTQFPIEVSAPTAESRALRPSQIVDAVISGLEQKAGNTLGLYSEFGGHAVTPIAVVKEGANFTISVYDSNDPGVIKHVVVDPATESWVYDAQANSSGVVTERWRGTGAGSMDLTPMALRSGAFTAPFGDGPDAHTYVTVTSPKDGVNVGAVISRGSTVIDTRSLSDDLPDDVVVHRITGAGAGVQVILTGDAEALEVRAVSTASTVMATLSVDAPGAPMITARGRTGTSASKALTITRRADGAVAVTSGTRAPVTTTISTQSETVNLEAPTSTEVHLSSAVAPQASLVTPEGSTLASYDTADNSPSSIGTTALELSPSGAGFVVARSVSVAEAPTEAPVIATPPAPNVTASATRERKERPETERGKRSERPSRPRPERADSAGAEPSVSPSPSRTRAPEKASGDSYVSDTHSVTGTSKPPTVSVTPSLSASASPSASGTASGPASSASPSASITASASASASASRTATPTSTPTATPTAKPSPTSTKRPEAETDQDDADQDDADQDDADQDDADQDDADQHESDD